MAKFVTENGEDSISEKEILDLKPLLLDPTGVTHTKEYISYRTKRHKDVGKLKVPSGRCNGFRLDNINMYDLLAHIQETLSITNRCIIELITNEDHRCVNENDTIRRRIHVFADEHMSESFKQDNPKIKIRFKVPDTEDEFDYRLETDEEYHDRLCHIFMHRNHPQKLQMIKCEECLQQWMNSDKW